MMLCVGCKRIFLIFALLVISKVVDCQGQNGGTQWQANTNTQTGQEWSVNAIPDKDGNWQAVGNSVGGPPQNGQFAMPVNSDMGGGNRQPRPMSLNNRGNPGNQSAESLNNRLPNARGPMKFLMRGRNSLNGTQDMKGMMSEIMQKGKGAMNKFMESLKARNGSLIVVRQPRQFMPSACTQEMLQIQTDCFNQAGYSMNSFLDSLRNGSFTVDDTSSAVSGFKNQICEKRQSILDCAIPKIIDKRDKPPCLDVHDYNFGEEMALKGLRIIQDICQAGLLPPPPICVPLVNREMQRCYTKVGFSPDMFISNDSNVEGAVIGKDFQAAEQFCGARAELYECMRLVLRNCPDADEHLLITGHDQKAIENSIDVLCNNKKVYVDGLACFQTPSETVHNCIDVMSSQTLDLEARQMLTSMSKSDFYKEFCKIRVQHMECDTTAWKESCHKVTVGLKNEFQCAMLPNICHNITEIDTLLHNRVCKQEAYLQALRAPYNSGIVAQVSWVLSVVVSIGLGVLMVV